MTTSSPIPYRLTVWRPSRAHQFAGVAPTPPRQPNFSERTT